MPPTELGVVGGVGGGVGGGVAMVIVGVVTVIGDDTGCVRLFSTSESTQDIATVPIEVVAKFNCATSPLPVLPGVPFNNVPNT